jgi:hypothetical protein
MEKEMFPQDSSSSSHKNMIVESLGIKWARDCKEGLLALTTADEQSCPEDYECRTCSYSYLCRKVPLSNNSLN